MNAYVKTIFNALPKGCTDADTIADAIFSANVPAKMMHAVHKRVTALKVMEGFYSPLPTHYACGKPTNAPAAFAFAE